MKESKHDIDETIDLIADTLEASGYSVDSQFTDRGNGKRDGAIFVNDTINKRTYAIHFDLCDEYEGE